MWLFYFLNLSPDPENLIQNYKCADEKKFSLSSGVLNDIDLPNKEVL